MLLTALDVHEFHIVLQMLCPTFELQRILTWDSGDVLPPGCQWNDAQEMILDTLCLADIPCLSEDSRELLREGRHDNCCGGDRLLQEYLSRRMESP